MTNKNSELILIPKYEKYMQYMIEVIIKMPRTIRNEYYKKLNYENLMKAHLESRKGKGLRKEIILFNMKQEEYMQIANKY